MKGSDHIEAGPRAGSRERTAVVWAVFLAMIVAFVSAPGVEAYVYWGSSSPDGKIGRAQTDGTSPV